MFKKADQQTYRQLLDGVQLGTMVHGEKTLMAQFKLTKGCVIPAHDHPHEQTGVVISGRIVLTVDGVDHEASPGDSWCIGPNVSHAARAVEDAVVVEVFTPVREDYL